MRHKTKSPHGNYGEECLTCIFFNVPPTVWLQSHRLQSGCDGSQPRVLVMLIEHGSVLPTSDCSSQYHAMD